MTFDEILEFPPTDPVRSINYDELLELWRRQHTPQALDESEISFNAWDRKVQALLGGRELSFYLASFNGLDATIFAFRKVSRVGQLTKILVYRQGIKTQSGFNG